VCVRYNYDLNRVEVWSRLLKAWIVADAEEMDRVEVFLGQSGLILDGERKLMEAQWGLVPPWAKDASFGKQTYNARSETVQERPSFKDPFRLRRCLIPLSSFFEQDDGRWHQISPVDSPVIAAAGLFERPNDVSPVTTYTMLTTEPNELVKRVQDRMPVLLDPADYDAWLDPKANERDLLALLAPYPSERLKIDDAGPNRRKPVIQDSLF